MPNHVSNVLTIEATDRTVDFKKELKAVLKKIKSGREKNVNLFDFNKVIPMPKELEGTVSPMTIISEKEYKAQEERVATGQLTENEKMWGGISRCLTAKLSNEYKRKFGADNWYEWKIRNWGTKWGAYDVVVNDNVVEFNTAWSTAPRVIEVLSELFPTLKFSVEYADEDTGYNCGTYECEEGSTYENALEGGSEEAYELAFKLNGCFLDCLDDASDEEAQEAVDGEKDGAYLLATLKQALKDNSLTGDENQIFLKHAIELLVKEEKYEYAEVVKKFITEDNPDIKRVKD